MKNANEGWTEYKGFLGVRWIVILIVTPPIFLLGLSDDPTLNILGWIWIVGVCLAGVATIVIALRH
ncbi:MULTISPECIES: hypothetical protein [unclassified Ornithinimicrobium]|uniref:hypothetical protein n=1 Tax=unclassified Ornithinimicrobium TaxID=2615080 RepID=UPI0038530E15